MIPGHQGCPITFPQIISLCLNKGALDSIIFIENNNKIIQIIPQKTYDTIIFNKLALNLNKQIFRGYYAPSTFKFSFAIQYLSNFYYKVSQNTDMDVTQTNQMEQLQKRAEGLQKENKYKQALDVYEELLQINKNTYGAQSEQYQRISIKLCELCNLISMILLQKQKYDVCLLFLKKAQSFCLKLPKQTAVTYNNYACHYRKTGKHRTALMYLQSALELQWKQRNNNSLADTYLNLCAVLSQLGKHSQALQNVLFSITLLQEELFASQKENIERIPVLAIAYHNMAVQLQYLKRIQESLATYEKAANYARANLGQEHSLTQNLQNVYKNAQQGQYSTQKKMQRGRGDHRQKVQGMKRTYNNRQQRPNTGFKSVKKV